MSDGRHGVQRDPARVRPKFRTVTPHYPTGCPVCRTGSFRDADGYLWPRGPRDPEICINHVTEANRLAFAQPLPTKENRK